jgi:hypothetical protein
MGVTPRYWRVYMGTHYVDNAKMLQEIKLFKEARMKSEEEGTKAPRIPEYLGECMLKIANNLSLKSNFINYSYREDMVLDGIENCIKCINSFDPDKGSNPFAYFTQVIYFAFLRRIEREKKESYVKSKLINDSTISSFDTQFHDEDEEFRNAFASFIQANSNFDDSFIKNKEKKKAAKKVAETLENFID